MTAITVHIPNTILPELCPIILSYLSDLCTISGVNLHTENLLIEYGVTSASQLINHFINRNKWTFIQFLEDIGVKTLIAKEIESNLSIKFLDN